MCKNIGAEADPIADRSRAEETTSSYAERRSCQEIANCARPRCGYSTVPRKPRLKISQRAVVADGLAMSSASHHHGDRLASGVHNLHGWGHHPRSGC